MARVLRAPGCHLRKRILQQHASRALIHRGNVEDLEPGLLQQRRRAVAEERVAEEAALRVMVHIEFERTDVLVIQLRAQRCVRVLPRARPLGEERVKPRGWCHVI